MKDFKETWLECWKAWGESKTMTLLKLPKMVPDEECRRLLKWVDSLTIEEVQELEKIYNGEDIGWKLIRTKLLRPFVRLAKRLKSTTSQI